MVASAAAESTNGSHRDAAPLPIRARRRQLQTEPPKSSILVNVDKSSQEMTVFVDGVERYSWPVSTGHVGLFHPVRHLYRQLR